MLNYDIIKYLNLHKENLKMDEFIKLLDKDLEYIEHQIENDTMYITVRSNKEFAICPYCGHESNKVHSTYQRSFKDLPMQGKKVIIVLLNRKVFCKNSLCNHKTFAERFIFLDNKAKKTKRLEEEILKISSHCSSISAANLLSTNTVAISKSTICNLLKKRYRNYR